MVHIVKNPQKRLSWRKRNRAGGLPPSILILLYYGWVFVVVVAALKGRPVSVTAQQICGREHSPGLETSIPVDDQGVPLDLDLLHERHPCVLEIPQFVLRLLRLKLNLADGVLKLIYLLNKSEK